MTQTLPLSEVKARLSELVDRVDREHDRVVLTRRGRPTAVLVSVDDLEGLEETLAILSDPKAVEDIRKAEEEIRRGETVSLDQVRAELVARQDRR